MNAGAQQGVKLAILFADISGSTALYDKLGNAAALQIISRTLSLLAAEVSRYRGTLVKTIGDEILCTFPSAEAAVGAACAMQTIIEAQQPGGAHPVHVRIGIHFGEVLQEGNDIFGDAVNVAARVSAITRARQILLTRDVVALLPAGMRGQTRPMIRTGLRGKEEAFELFLALWEPEDTMSTRIGMSAFRKPSEARHELILRYHEQIITLSEQKKCIVLGRAETCDLMFYNNLASRQHAHIEYNFGKFMLTDHSANGTFIRFSDQQAIQLYNQQIVLHGAGSISLGQSFADAPVEVIEYIVQ